MLIVRGITNLFMKPKYAKRLELALKIIKEVKVSFAKRGEIVCLVAKNIEFKSRNKKFWEDFRICSLSGIDAVLRNTFLRYYRMKLQWKSKI